MPLVCQVIEHASSTVGLAQYSDLLQRAQRLLPPHAEVVFLADRGFVDTALMAYLNQTLHWHFRIRFKKGIQLYRQGARKRRKLRPQAAHGHARFYHNVWVSKEFYGPAHIAFARLKGSRETWFIVSDQPTSARTLQQ